MKDNINERVAHVVAHNLFNLSYDVQQLSQRIADTAERLSKLIRSPEHVLAEEQAGVYQEIMKEFETMKAEQRPISRGISMFKKVRDRTGMSFMEAKTYVEALEKQFLDDELAVAYQELEIMEEGRPEFTCPVCDRSVSIRGAMCISCMAENTGRGSV
jgi:ribosomal protein L7/L12